MADEGDATHWVKTTGLQVVTGVGLPLLGGMQTVIWLLFFEALGGRGVALALVFENPHQNVGQDLTNWFFVVILPIALLLAVLAGTIRRVGAGIQGVRVDYWLGSCTFSWESLSSWGPRPGRYWGFLSGRRISATGACRLFSTVTFCVTRDQAKVIFMQPKAAKGRIADGYLAWAGLNAPGVRP